MSSLERVLSRALGKRAGQRGAQQRIVRVRGEALSEAGAEATADAAEGDFREVELGLEASKLRVERLDLRLRLRGDFRDDGVGGNDLSADGGLVVVHLALLLSELRVVVALSSVQGVLEVQARRNRAGSLGGDGHDVGRGDGLGDDGSIGTAGLTAVEERPKKGLGEGDRPRRGVYGGTRGVRDERGKTLPGCTGLKKDVLWDMVVEKGPITRWRDW